MIAFIISKLYGISVLLDWFITNRLQKCIILEYVMLCCLICGAQFKQLSIYKCYCFDTFANLQVANFEA